MKLPRPGYRSRQVFGHSHHTACRVTEATETS
jgi:hypothetical protein